MSEDGPVRGGCLDQALGGRSLPTPRRRIRTRSRPASSPVTTVVVRSTGRTFRLGAQVLGQVERDEAPVVEQLEVAAGRLALGREVVAHEDRVGGLQREALDRTEVDLAPTGDPDLGGREQEAIEGQDPEAALRGQLPRARQRRPVDGDEEVDRDRVDVERSQCEPDIDDVVVGLTHPEQCPGARRQSGVLGRLDGRDAVVEAMGRTDVAVVTLGRVQVVVVGVDPGRGEAIGLSVGEKSETGAHLEAGVGVAHCQDRVGDLFDLVVRRSPAAGHQAHPGCARGDRPLRGVRHDVGADGAVGHDPGFGPTTLRAVAAVLGAQPGLQVDQEVHLHGVREGGPSDPTGRRDRGERVRVGETQDRQRILAGRGRAGPGRAFTPFEEGGNIDSRVGDSGFDHVGHAEDGRTAGGGTRNDGRDDAR